MNAEDLPSECANGCGFYGNRATRNMCSRCYRDFLKKSTLETQVNLSHTVNKLTSASHADDVTTSLKTTDVTATAAVTKTTNRCVTCTKRVGLTGFKCRCGGMFCGSHRHPEAHSCGFDHKKLALEALSKTLYSATECKGAKLD